MAHRIDMVSSVLALDPGARTGWALLRKFVEWRLDGCGVLTPEEDMSGLERVDLVVIENPQIYPHSKARPNDILTLARVVGRYEERFRARRVQLVHPRDWKGSIDGDVMVARIEAALSPLDRNVLASYKGGYRHNAVDAIGMGYWAVRQPFMRGSPT